MGHAGLGVREMLVERAPEGHVEHLVAAADREHRQVQLEGCSERGQLEGVMVGPDAPQRLVPLGGAVGRGVDVATAEEEQAVEPAQDLG